MNIFIKNTQSAPILIDSLPKMKINIGEGAQVTVLNIPKENGPETAFISFHLAKNAKLTLWNLYLGAASGAHTHEIVFEEEYAEAENHTIYFGTKKSRLKLSTIHIHKVPRGTSRIASHGILNDEAFARYEGLIKILPEGTQTDASLEEKTLLLSSNARVEAVPGLEIGTNDVRANHSAGMTRIDEDQLFYAASRGIGEREAVRLIAEGFLKHALEGLSHQETRKYAERTISDLL